MAIIFSGSPEDFKGIDLKGVLKKLGLPPEAVKDAQKMVDKLGAEEEAERRHSMRLKAKLENMKPLGLGAEFDGGGVRIVWKGEAPDPEVQAFMLNLIACMQLIELVRQLQARKVPNDDIRVLSYAIQHRAQEAAEFVDQETRK